MIITLLLYPKFESDYKVDFNLLSNELFRSYLSGYKKAKNLYNCPLVDYFKAIKSLQVLDLLNFYSDDNNLFFKKTYMNFSLEDRFKYGLPICEDDKIEVKKIIIKVN